MRVKDSRGVGIRHKFGQCPRHGPRDFIPSLVQLLHDGLHAERLVDRLFRRGSHDSMAAAQALIVKDYVSIAGNRAKARKRPAEGEIGGPATGQR
jgi:hypothetical protein